MVCNILKSEKVRFLIRVVILSLLFPLVYSYFHHLYDFFMYLIDLIPPVIQDVKKIISFFISIILLIKRYMILTCFYSFVLAYMYLKLFGLLKKSDKFNFFYVIVTFLIGIYMVQPIINHMSNDIITFNITLLFIPVFLLHRFFNFLTKKFPIPFEKIRYYTSIECLNDFYNNHKNHKQIEETKEIEKTSFIHKILKSEKFNFILRMIIAFLLLSQCYEFLLTTCCKFAVFITTTPLSFMLDFLPELIILIVIFATAIIGPCLAMYLYLKIFGILKQSDKMNPFFTFFIFLVASCIHYICLYLHNRDDIAFDILLLVGFFLAFFLHKFFNFLTKKFPTPFEQIGYYTSIEFVKDLLRPMVRK